MASIYYDHAKRKAWETEVRTDPSTGGLYRAMVREIPYDGESPFPASAGKAQTPQEKLQADAEKLRREIVGFLAHSDESPLKTKERNDLARQMRWHEEHK